MMTDILFDSKRSHFQEFKISTSNKIKIFNDNNIYCLLKLKGRHEKKDNLFRCPPLSNFASNMKSVAIKKLGYQWFD